MDEINCAYYNPIYDASTSLPIGFGSSTCEVLVSSTPSSSLQGFYNGFSYGELVSTVLLFILTMAVLYNFIFLRT